MQCKVDAVQAFIQPTTKKQVRAFTGLCGYYRRFIPNFSTIATPLMELTRKRMDNKVKWTPPCEQSFQLLGKNVNRISSVSNTRLEKNVYSTDGCLGLWPRLCVMPNKRRWIGTPHCLWIPEITTTRAEILGHRTGSPSHSLWNSSFPDLLGGNKIRSADWPQPTHSHAPHER